MITTKFQDGCGVVDDQKKTERVKWKMSGGLFNQLIHIFNKRPLISSSYWRLRLHLGYNNKTLLQFHNKCSPVKLFMISIRSSSPCVLILHFLQRTNSSYNFSSI